MKIISSILFVFMVLGLYAQPASPAPINDLQMSSFMSNLEERKEGWLIRGNNTITFTQNTFSNWIAGGVNAFALNGNVDYEFNLTRGKHIWDNRAILAYGFQKQQDQGQRKTNDVIDLNSLYGYQLKPKWFATTQLNFRSQFDQGIDYENGNTLISNFAAPAYLRLGIGVDYRPSESFNVTFHPATSRFTFVLDEDLQLAGNYGLENDGDALFFELGTFLGARHQFSLGENIGFNHQLSLYSNYLKDTKNVDVLYNSRLNLNVNRFITTELMFDLIYDDNQIGRSQIRQSLGVGFVYAFDNAPKASELDQAQKTFEEAKAALEAAKAKAAEAEAAKEALEEGAKAVEDAAQREANSNPN